jgi:S1-C subfamily serine protease
MKHFLTLLIFAVSAACCPANSPSGVPSNTSVALLRTKNVIDPETNTVVETTMRPFCSGNFVGEREILTASHCITAYEELFDQTDESVSIDILMPGEVGTDNQPVAVHKTKLLRIDRDNDLALLVILQKDFHHSFARVAEEEPEIYDKVYTMGTPRGLYFTAGDGIVSATHRLLPDSDFAGEFTQIGAPETFFGSSGSAVFNTAGEVLGVVSMTSGAPSMIFITGTRGTFSFVHPK